MLEVKSGLLLGSQGDAMAVLHRVPSVIKQYTVTHILTISTEPLDLSEANAVIVEDKHDKCNKGSIDQEVDSGHEDVASGGGDVVKSEGSDSVSSGGSEPAPSDSVNSEDEPFKSASTQSRSGSPVRSNCDGKASGKAKETKQILVKFVCLIDRPKSDLLHHFESCCKFIQEGIRAGGTVLVHCVHGISRSVSVVLAYQMWSEGRSFKMVYEELKQKKPEISPNHGFVDQLKLWGAMRCRYDHSNKKYKKYRLKTVAKEMRESGYTCTEKVGLTPDPSSKPVDSTAYYRCRKCRRLLFTDECVLPHEVGKGEAAFKWHKRTKPGSPLAHAKTTPTEACPPPLTDAASPLENDCELDEDATTNGDTHTPSTDTQGELAKIRAKMATVVAAQPVGDDRCSSVFIEPVEWMESALLGTVEGKVLCPKCSARLGSFNWSGDQCSCGQWITPAFQIHKARVDETRTLTRRKAAKTD